HASIVDRPLRRLYGNRRPALRSTRMTKRRIPTTSWRDALFNSLSATKGGFDGFCAWAGASRNRRIAPSTLYGRLDGTRPGERTPIEDAELITEYAKADAHAHPAACDWI